MKWAARAEMLDELTRNGTVNDLNRESVGIDGLHGYLTVIYLHYSVNFLQNS